MRKSHLLAGLCTALLLSACMGDAPKPLPGAPKPREPFHPPVEMMLKYDANKDGSITRAEMDAGLRAEFAAADTNHNGVLEIDEMRVVNAQRLSSEGSAASPLIDWNEDGHVDFHEYAGSAHAIFDQFDADEDGVLTPDELHPHHYQHHEPAPMMNPYSQQ
jgi:hypothetical protein